MSIQVIDIMQSSLKLYDIHMTFLSQIISSPLELDA